MSLLRPVGTGDRDFVLALNEEHVELLSPLDDDRLTELLGWADLAALIEPDGVPAGFVITMPSGTPYDSVNYAWFTERYPSFYYLDRAVLAEQMRRSGLGSRTYDEIEARAAEQAPVMCLEVNLEPPNEPSLAFHRKRGYTEVGRGVAGGHTVSLLVKTLR